jgi:hypothetical protein
MRAMSAPGCEEGGVSGATVGLGDGAGARDGGGAGWSPVRATFLEGEDISAGCCG